jgi:ArsR family transcriptional regulator
MKTGAPAMRKVKSTLFEDLESVAMVLRALSNSSRLRITLALLNTELSVASLEETLEIKQPNLSQQLAELRKAGILKARRSAKSVFYSIADANVREVIALIAVSIGKTDGASAFRPVVNTEAEAADAADITGTAPKPAARVVPAAKKVWQGEEAQFAKVWPSAGR